jgi:hypothetical protein
VRLRTVGKATWATLAVSTDLWLKHRKRVRARRKEARRYERMARTF